MSNGKIDSQALELLKEALSRSSASFLFHNQGLLSRAHRATTADAAEILKEAFNYAASYWLFYVGDLYNKGNELLEKLGHR